MLFNSLQYLFFFPTVALLYFLLPYGRPRIVALLLASCVFYMAFIPKYILILFILIGIDFGAAFLIDENEGPRRKAWLVLSLVANLGMLSLFKYYGLFADTLATLTGWFGHPFSPPLLALVLPLGLSFHTFQSMSYTIDVYRKKKTVERDILKYALYVLFFPQLVAGPIERAGHLIPQFDLRRDFDIDRAASGGRLILRGLIKKVVVADRLAPYVDLVCDHPQGHPGLVLLFAAWFGSLQFYCDISGYTDIARGSARILGIELVKNFERPFASRNVAEFWRRYHMSFFSWFRDYLYIPLGGARGSATRRLFNPLLTFALAGLWHGANWTFAIWGVFQGAMVSLSHLWRKARKSNNPAEPGALRNGWGTFWAIFLTLNAWSITNVFFRCRTLGDAWYMFTHIPQNLAAPIDTVKLAYTPYDFALAFCFIAAIIGAHIVGEKVNTKRIYAQSSPWVRWGLIYAGLAVLLTLGKFTGQTFLYFQF